MTIGVLALAGCATKEKTEKPKAEGGGIPGASITKAVTRATAGAHFKAPIGATRIGAVVLYDRLRTQTLGNAGLSADATHVNGQPLIGAGGEAFERLLDSQGLPPRTQGSVEFLLDGSQFFPTFLEAIQEARSSYDGQTFIFDNDDVAVKVADALKAKSQEIPVRIYFDGNGSATAADKAPKTLPRGFTPPKDIYDYMTTGSNVQARRSANAYMVADHTKVHIIDGHTAFIGGMNIGREYWHELHDMMARVRGPVVPQLAAIFEKHWRGDAWWRKIGPRRAPDSPLAAAPTSANARMEPLRILRTETRNAKREVLKAALIAFRCASKRIWIETPYYSSDEVTRELQAAVKRGVDVRVVVPEDNDYEIMESNNAADLKKLIDLGAKVYSYPGMTHLKATVVDNWGMFGSANYDTLSLRVNVELNLALSDPRSVNWLARNVFERDFRVSTRLTSGMAEAKAKKAGGGFAEFIGDQL